MVKVIEGAKVANTPERILIFGAPKVGKTTLATALPWGDKWGEKAIYVASDNNSESLRPVIEHNREHLVVVVPDGMGSKTWMEEAWKIALTPWHTNFPTAKTLIWDTMTTTTQSILREYADSGVFSNNHNVQVGSKSSGSWHVSPMEGDYGAAQDTLARLLNALLGIPMNLIVLFHEDFVEPKAGALEGVIGGPASVGKKAIRWVPGKFDTVLYMQRLMASGGSKVVVNTSTVGIWQAGVRNGRLDASLPAQIPLDRDPSGFWKTYFP